MITEHIVALFTPTTENSLTEFSAASWTQPADTVGRLYYRVTITTPGGSCQSAEAAVLGSWKFRLNGFNIGGGSGNSITLGPGETTNDPVVGSIEYPTPLFPGQYELRTGEFGTLSIAPDCADTIVETEVFVETVASA